MKKYSKKLSVQLIAEIFSAFDIQHIVLSPGSRNGALATHFSHHPKFKTYSIVDERSAGFVALGMAQQLKKPVVVCCTSGSALVNYYPAVTEAFYQNVPLIVLSADRPEQMIDQFDGQTIRQKDVFASHILSQVQLSEDESPEALSHHLTLVKKALAECIFKSGPVHINMPFSEPLYEFQPTIDIHFEKFEIPKKIKTSFEISDFADRWNSAQKKLVLVGLHSPDKKLNQLLSKLADDDSVAVLTETTSNLHSPRFFNKIDAVIISLSDDTLENLKPDILLTVGQNVVSKKIKAFLRNHKPAEHWHLDPYWQPDTFQALTDKISMEAVDFLENFIPEIYQQSSHYYNDWNSIRVEKQKMQKEFAAKTAYSDFKVFEQIIKNLPRDIHLQYGNSSAIRYAQLFDHPETVSVFCNRGTSGIDGSTSTAAGAAMVSPKQTLLITGDVSFFYDSNGLWNNYLPENFRIILINNGGGNIFKIIPGPESSGVLEEIFETVHLLNASHLAAMYGFGYAKVNNLEELNESLSRFFLPSGRPEILEIDTTKAANSEVMRAYFKI